ncbi:MAG TPA: YihY/virulence factor BrkB family protein [Acidobacteriaceae bacterium]|nr:YihY/virulence factor BrkB family protein [Acidobacteriaceae bacterium]
MQQPDRVDYVAELTKKQIEPIGGTAPRSESRVARTGFSLGGHSPRQLIHRVWICSFEDEIFDRAAELAYYFLFSLFPALIFLSAMFGLFATTRTQSNVVLTLYLSKVIPPGAFGIVAGAFTTTAKGATTGKIFFGAITALWAATYGMSSAQTILNSVFRVKESRAYWKAKLIALCLTLAIFILVFFSMLLLLLGDYLIKLGTSDWLFNESILIAWKVVQVVAALFFMSLVFSLTYHWGPDRKGHKWRWISPGSVVGIAGWLAVSIGFRIYLHFFNSYALLYGSVGTVIILLTWFYVSGLMLLLGAEINAVIERANRG